MYGIVLLSLLLLFLIFFLILVVILIFLWITPRSKIDESLDLLGRKLQGRRPPAEAP